MQPIPIPKRRASTRINLRFLNIAKWFIRLIALVVAFDALGLLAVLDVLRQLLLWLPNLVVAMVVLVVAGLLATALGKIVRGASAQAGFTNPDTLATVAKVAVWGFAIVVALNQIGIAEPPGFWPN